VSGRHRWERAAFTLHDEATGTSALVVLMDSVWEWSVVDGRGVEAGRGSVEKGGESMAKGQAAKVFEATVKAWKP
jgi:hypothetical protein